MDHKAERVKGTEGAETSHGAILLGAFALGLAAVGWVGAGYLGGHPLALAMVGLIAAAYLTGAAELRRFHGATQDLHLALADLPAVQQAGGDAAALGPWLAQLHPSLQTPVRLRIEGQRLALPGPMLTPYLVGLLVLLGMLGTFLGMVVTMQGAVLALQSTTDLATIRQALAAPVQGLGLAFGTSVAGVAASAMLGLMSALCRRRRQQAAQTLDRLAALHLGEHAPAHGRAQTLAALQALQAHTEPLQQLPQVLSQAVSLAMSQALAQVLGQMQALSLQATAQAQSSHETLQHSQALFHQQALANTTALAAALQQQMQQALHEGARLAGATLQPLVQTTLASVQQQAADLQAGAAQALQQQLQGQAARFEQQQAAWLQHMAQGQADQQARAAAADQQRLAQWSAQLENTSLALQQAWQAAGEQAQAQQVQICTTLAHTAQGLQAQAQAQARDTLAELSGLAARAAQAPQAAAELVQALRQKLSDSLTQDQQLLTERTELMARLGSLLQGLERQADSQRQATEALLATAAQQLQHSADALHTRVAADSQRMAEAATDLGASAVDMAALSDAFGAAVHLFGHSSGALGTQLQQIGTALTRSTARSDEQLAYYLAQAREIIDLSIASQQQIVQDLRQLAQPRPALAREPAEPAKVAEPAAGLLG